MNRFLKHFRQRGKDVELRARLVNYADDFVILSRGKARDAMAWTRRVMTAIGLTMNETKTCIRDARTETFDFLGYTFGTKCFTKTGRRYLTAWPSKKSSQRIKEGVRGLLQPSNQGTWPDVVRQLNRKLRGWTNYFSYGARYPIYQQLDYYVYDRVRYFLRRRCKVSTRGTRRFSNSEVFGSL